MSDYKDICLRRPDLCGEAWREAAREEAMKEEAREPEEPLESPEEPQLKPAVELKPALEAGVVIRRKGLLSSSYWELRNDASALPGDVVVVLPDRWLLLRPVKKPAVWLNADGRFYVPRGSLDHIVQLARSGAIIAVMCDPRAKVKPPRRIELQGLWRTDGYLVNLSPARIAVYQLDPYRGKRRFLADLAKKGCPIYSHWANQILQALGVLAKLTC